MGLQQVGEMTFPLEFLPNQEVMTATAGVSLPLFLSVRLLLFQLWQDGKKGCNMSYTKCVRHIASMTAVVICRLCGHCSKKIQLQEMNYDFNWIRKCY